MDTGSVDRGRIMLEETDILANLSILERNDNVGRETKP